MMHLEYMYSIYFRWGRDMPLLTIRGYIDRRRSPRFIYSRSRDNNRLIERFLKLQMTNKVLLKCLWSKTSDKSPWSPSVISGVIRDLLWDTFFFNFHKKNQYIKIKKNLFQQKTIYQFFIFKNRLSERWFIANAYEIYILVFCQNWELTVQSVWRRSRHTHR